MIPYKEWSPTGFDTRGLGLEDRQEWLVLSCCARNRDSGTLDESNFHSAVEALGGEGEDVEVHRFGHWGNGWFEIILVRPGTSAEKEANDIEDALDEYPILDDNDLSDRQCEAEGQDWKSYGERDFAKWLAEQCGHHGGDFFMALSPELYSLFRELEGCSEMPCDNEGTRFEVPEWRWLESGKRVRVTWPYIRKCILYVLAERRCREHAKRVDEQRRDT